MVGLPEMERIKGGVGIHWGSFLVAGVPDGNGFSGGWNAATGSLRNGFSPRRSLIGRASWCLVGDPISIL